jgi:oligopeptide/dipeptide ABC transporter ATP-binding protein
MTDRLLTVNDLKTHFRTSEGVFPAVDGVSFHMDKGETVGLVGESGCGKSVTALSLLGLVPDPPGRIVGGQIIFQGRDIVALPADERRHIRGNRIAMIFQEPMTSLNPVYTVGMQLMEPLRFHRGLSKGEARAGAIEALKQVGIPAPERRIDDYPHQLSGGMRQRVMIAMALTCEPRLLIADEPTTALDVTIQAQILELLKTIKKTFGTAILMITHDLGVIAETAQRVIVMYAGKIVEEAPVRDIFKTPLHPYTQGLLASIPRIDAAVARLSTIEGVVPNPLHYPAGCRFQPRCPRAMTRCAAHEPPLVAAGPGRRVACWLAGKEVAGHE